MKKTGFLIAGMIVFISTLSFGAVHFLPVKTTLSGKITDKKTGESLPGVSVYLPDLKTGAISDINGMYKIENLPLAKVLVQVSFLGYKLISENIKHEEIVIKDFEM